MTKAVTIGTAGGNKGIAQITLGAPTGNKNATEGWIGTSGGNKQFWPSYPPLSVSASGEGWYQTESGSPYYFSAGASASGGSGSYTYSSSDGTSGPGVFYTWTEADPPQIDIYWTVTDTVTGLTADSNTVSSTPP